MKSTNQTFTDPYNPQWGWSWLERWMAARPWDDRIAAIKEHNSSNDPATVKTSPKVNAKSSNNPLPVKTTPKVNARSTDKEPRNDPLPVKTAPKVNDSKRSATPNKQNFPPASQQSTLNTASIPPAAPRLPAQVSPKENHENDDPGSKTSVHLSSKESHENHENDDPRSKTSENSENSRRHSSAEAMERECEHIASPQASRSHSFMAPTESTKARSRMASGPLLILEKRYGTPEKRGSAKNKLSSNGVPRRHSAPPAMI